VNGRPLRHPDGRFDLAGPADGGLASVIVQSEGFAPTVVRTTVPVDTEVPLLDVALGPGVELVGEVLDAATLRPVVEARATLADPVEVERLREGQKLTRLVDPGLTGRGGFFLVSRAPLGSFLLVVYHPGYRLEVQEIDTSAGYAHAILHRGGAIAGSVRSEGGAPVAGARVVAVSPAAVDAAETRTDGSGRFRLGAVRPGRYQLLPLVQGGRVGSTLDVEVADDVVAEATLRLR
jgi:hypothetical protein